MAWVQLDDPWATGQPGPKYFDPTTREHMVWVGNPEQPVPRWALDAVAQSRQAIAELRHRLFTRERQATITRIDLSRSQQRKRAA